MINWDREDMDEITALDIIDAFCFSKKLEMPSFEIKGEKASASINSLVVPEKFNIYELFWVLCLYERANS